MEKMQEYEQRLRTIERRAMFYFFVGSLCMVVATILMTTRRATIQPTQQQILIQPTQPQTFTAPFRVVDTKGIVLFEVTDNQYGGRLSMYNKSHRRIVDACSGEVTTAITITGEKPGIMTSLGTNTKRGFISLQAKGAVDVFHKGF